MDAMEAMIRSRTRLEQLRAERATKQTRWETLCCAALSRRCSPVGLQAPKSKSAKMRREKAKPVPSRKEKEEETREALRMFYEKYNPAKAQDVEKIMAHFKGRLEELGEALMVQYGADFAEFTKMENGNGEEDAEDAEVGEDRSLAQRIEKLFHNAVEELHLPYREYLIRSSADTSMFGVKDLWLETFEGQLRVDLCVRERVIQPVSVGGSKAPSPKKQKVTELSIRTDKPVTLKCKIDGLKAVDGIRASAQPMKTLGKPFELESVDVDASIEFALVFLYEKKRWRAADSFKFHLTRLKTNKPFADPILRSVMNATIPGAIKSAFEKNLGPEIGSIMLSSCGTGSEGVAGRESQKPVGLAMLLEVNLHGWPSASEFCVDLPVAVRGRDEKLAKLAKSILRRLELSEDQLRSLEQLNTHFRKSGGKASASDSAESWKKGVFPLQHISLEELLNLHKGLYVGELVSMNQDEPGGISDEEASIAGSEYTEEGDTSDEEEVDGIVLSTDEEDDQVAQLRVNEKEEGFGAQNPDFRHLNEFKFAEDSAVFAREYADVVSTAAKAQAVAQQILDSICEKSEIEKWSLSHFVTRVESVVLRKKLSLELHLHAIDLRVNADATVDVLRAATWQQVKISSAKLSEEIRIKRLRHIHKAFNTVRYVISAFKSLAGNLKLTTTGAITGGQTPAFEFSIKDLSSEGVLDLQLGNLRLGGLFKEFAVWFMSFAHLLRQGSAMSKIKRRESALLLSHAKSHLMKHLELFQFFFDISMVTDSEANFIVSLCAQKENPRPALSVHVSGSLKELLEFSQKRRYRRPFGGMATGFSFPFEGSSVPAATLADQAMSMFAGTNEEVIRITELILRDHDVINSHLTMQDVFWIFGFSKFTLAMNSPSSFSENTFDDAATDDGEEDSSDTVSIG